ncbi:unnamed protein product [Rotaria sp. Silwood1]|nr:unnamed protein product [Rotaria sp. Silwood1]
MSFKNKILLIIVFGTVGTLDTLTESPLYGIAGFLNVSVHTIIRLIILLFHSKIDLDQLSFYIFMSVLIILSGLAIYVYYRLIYIPSVNIRMNQQMASFKRENPGNSVELYLVENELSFWELSKILQNSFVQCHVLFIRLLLWPDIFHVMYQIVVGLIMVEKLGSVHLLLLEHLILEILLVVQFHQYFSEKTYLFSAPLITLLATVTYMIHPKQIVGVNNCERAAYLMTAALYLGLATGSIVVAILTLTHRL